MGEPLIASEGFEGFLEEATHDGSRALLRGWVFARALPIRRLWACGADGQPIGLSYGVPRPDVAQRYPWARFAGVSGFDARVPATIGPRVEVWAELMDGARRPIFHSAVAQAAGDQPALADGDGSLTGPIFGYLDSPAAGAGTATVVEIRGWLVTRGAPLRSVWASGLTARDEPLSYGLSRPDVMSFVEDSGIVVAGFTRCLALDVGPPRDTILRIWGEHVEGSRVELFHRPLRLPAIDARIRRALPREEDIPRGELWGFLDLPTPMQETSPYGTIHFWGWLISRGRAIRRIWAGGVVRDPVPLSLGLPRPELVDLHGNAHGEAESGFAGWLFLDRGPARIARVQIWAELSDGERILCFTRDVRLPSTELPSASMGTRLRAMVRATHSLWQELGPEAWRRHFRRHLQESDHVPAKRDPPQGPLPWEGQDAYSRWRHTNRLTPALQSALAESAEAFAPDGPTISLLVPVFDPPERFLRALIESVRAQIYPRWQLCLVDDASTDPRVRALLEEVAGADARVRVTMRAQNGHIVEATNDALDLATGDFVALVDHDDLLPPDALLHIAECILRNPDVDWIYTDEDKIDEAGNRYDPQLKGEWSPEMAVTHNYTHHLTVLRRSVVEEVGRLRRGFEGAQELDLFLRVAERTPPGRIRHIPHVCYHWRAHGGSTASNGRQKSYIFTAAKRAIEDALARRGLHASPVLPAIADEHDLCLYQLRWDPDLLRASPVTVVVPTRQRGDLLRRCLTSLARTVDRRSVRVIIVDDGADQRELSATLRCCQLDCRVVRPPPPRTGFNYARLINFGCQHVETPLVLHLNDDVEALRPGWLEDMVGWMSIEGVGVVGARLLDRHDRVQHAGVVVGAHGGLPDHAFFGLPRNEVGYLCLPHAARNVSAVTGACLLTSMDLFARLEGFDEQTFRIQYNDVDYCLRAVAAGRRVVFTPGAELRHIGYASRGNDHDVQEHLPFLERYRGYREPFRNESLDADNMRMSPTPHHFSHRGRARHPLKLLLTTHKLTRDGAPLVALDYARCYRQVGGHEVVVATIEDGPLRAEFEALGIPVVTCPDMALRQTEAVSEWRRRVALAPERLGFSKLDLIVCNSILSWWAVVAARHAGKPSIWHIHEGVTFDTASLLLPSMDPAAAREVLSECLVSASRVIFQAGATEAGFARWNQRDHFRQIPGCIAIDEVDAFRAENGRRMLRRRHGISDEQLVLVHVATISERKAQHILVEALARLAEERVELPLCILVGASAETASYLDALKERLRRLGLVEHIRIEPVTPAYREFLALADLLVLPSYAESFPRILLEAMAFGLPIVASRVFGVPEMVEDERQGLLVAPGDPDALAGALRRLFEQRAFATLLGRNGFERARRSYAAERVLPRHLDLLDEAVLSP